MDDVREIRPATTRPRHQLTLRNRESLAVEGVANVDSFDEEQVVLQTTDGVLLIRGQGLHIKEFNVEKATLTMDGLVSSLEYAEEPLEKKSKSLLSRLFR
ncbi:MAG: sporulation protein YabP [Limnochordaceae bacterium]|nr:sporulation protein YabP [Limnochordaceae bacterium]